jgi:sporulation protein YlmC with PRC-barrel domain
MDTQSTHQETISSNNVEGTKVCNEKGEKLGTIDDLMIDKSSGQVRYAVMEFGGFMGMGTDRYPIPWKMLKYDTSQDGYLVPLDKELLDKAPRYQRDELPTYTRGYERSINDFWGAANR